MALEKSTKPSSASCELRDAALPSLDLDLPDAPDFVSLPPLVSLEKMIRRNQELRQLFPRGIPTDEERWQAKRFEEFRFID